MLCYLWGLFFFCQYQWAKKAHSWAFLECTKDNSSVAHQVSVTAQPRCLGHFLVLYQRICSLESETSVVTPLGGEMKPIYEPCTWKSFKTAV